MLKNYLTKNSEKLSKKSLKAINLNKSTQFNLCEVHGISGSSLKLILRV